MNNNNYYCYYYYYYYYYGHDNDIHNNPMLFFMLAAKQETFTRTKNISSTTIINSLPSPSPLLPYVLPRCGSS